MERRPAVGEMMSKRSWLKVAQVQLGDGQVFNMAEGGEVVWNLIQKPRSTTGVPVLVGVQAYGRNRRHPLCYEYCRTSFPGPFLVQGDPIEEVVSRSS